MSKLPRGWVWLQLKAIVKDGGGTIDPRRFPDEEFDLFSIPAYSCGKPERLQGNFIGSTKQLVQHGDVLLSKIVPHIRRVWVVPKAEGRRQIASGEWIVYRSSQLEPHFVRLALSESSFRTKFLGTVSGVGGSLMRASPKQVAEFSIPLPPLAEQKRIVAKLDALNARSARARSELARIETLVSRYKQAVLSKAFNGELTSGFDRRTSVEPLDANPGVNSLWSIPETWSWCRTDQIGRVGLGRQRSPKNHEGPQMRPYLRSANITWQGVDTNDVKEMNFDDADFKRFKLEVGDVLLNEGSGSAKEVGKPAIWRGEIADCCYQNTLLRVQPHRCSSEYAYYYFLLTARAGRFVSSTQGVNIQHIGREGLASYPFPLAPEPEQHEIVRRIESAFAKIDRLAKEAKRALELVGKLDEAILAKAFRGELVPQDENDEPAELLLERIRAERAAAPKTKGGRRAKG